MAPVRYAVVTPGNEVLALAAREREAISMGHAMGRAVIVDRSMPLEGFVEENPPSGPDSPKKAWRALHGLRINPDAAYRMDLEEAFLLLWPKFPLLRKGQPLKAWSTADAMTENLLGQNYKTAKGRAPGKGKKAAEKPKVPAPPMPAAQKKILEERYGKTGVDVQGLTLLPNIVWTKITGRKRINTCVGATRECAESCLVYSGRNEADPYNVVIKTAKLSALLAEPGPRTSAWSGSTSSRTSPGSSFSPSSSRSFRGSTTTTRRSRGERRRRTTI
jgi:hypothetical protein